MDTKLIPETCFPFSEISLGFSNFSLHFGRFMLYCNQQTMGAQFLYKMAQQTLKPLRRNGYKVLNDPT